MSFRMRSSEAVSEKIRELPNRVSRRTTTHENIQTAGPGSEPVCWNMGGRRHITGKLSRLESLKNLTERYDGYGNSIRRVMEAKSRHAGHRRCGGGPDQGGEEI